MTSATADRPQLVFVDGIGGRSVFRRPLLSHFAARGHVGHYIDYRPSRESFDAIRARLGDRLAAIAADGPYVLVGYSFGGVLARSVLTTTPDIRPPRWLFLVASPLRSLRMCRTARGWPPFRWLTGDCGQLLADEARMQAIGLPAVETTCIYGTQGYTGPLALAGRVPNDGMVAVDEVEPLRFTDALAVRASHPTIATSREVIAAIEARLSVQHAVRSNAESDGTKRHFG